MDGLDYDTCAQFLARLDADAENNVLSAGAPSSTSSRSPVDRTSSSPPGFSSAASLSPESFGFNYEDNISSQLWTDFPTPFNDISNPYFTGTGNWGDNTFMQPQGQQQTQAKQRDVVSPGMSDYNIKTEDQGYFNGQPMTISPRSSLLDPNVQTAYEGSEFPYIEDGSSDPLYSFSTFDQRQQPKQPESAWRNQGSLVKEDFTPINWQQQQPQQQQQQQQQQPQLQQQLLQQQQQVRAQQQQQQQHQRQQIPQQTNMFRSNSSPQSSSSPESNHHDSLDETQPRSKKRKTSDTPEPHHSPPHHNQTSTNRKQQPKKTAHNMIEKRYRTNLNDKIAALRDSVPSLRVMAGTSKLGDDDEEEDLEGLTPAHKLNKATVLAKATEYIRHLEKRSKKLQEENEHLKNRLSAFEKLATMGGAMTGGAGRTASTGPGGGLMSRLMVGSLAGLMVANGLQEQEGNSRGLFAFPIPFSMPFDMSVSQSVVSSHQNFLLVLKVLLFFTAIAYVFSPGFFDSKPKKAKAMPVQPVLSAAPSLASPVEERRRAWLTAIQTVSVPQSFWLELAALGLKFIKLGIRQCVGWDGYSWLTGMTAEQEAARVKAWTIALDAQLAGGDQHVTHARLLLSLLASFTLPATPSRLMLNALHIRVLFWDLHTAFESFAQKLSDYYWNEARKLQMITGQSEPLPEHLTRLLELEPSVVLNDRIIQRAYNLCYNRPTEADDNEKYHDEGMNAVVEDQSIRSPLDAVGAWYSSLTLHQAFLTSLKGIQKQSDVSHMNENLDIALKVAPPSSGAHLRVLASRAVLLCSAEAKDLQTLLGIFKDDFAAAERAPNNTWSEKNRLQQGRTVNVTPDIKIALRCAMALTMIKQASDKGRMGGMRLFSDFDWAMGEQETKTNNANARSGSATPVPIPTIKKPTIKESQLGLLGFVVAWKTLNEIVSDKDLYTDAREPVARAAGTLRRWIGHQVAVKAGVEKDLRRKLVTYCMKWNTRMEGMERGDESGDAGYVSGDN